MVLRGEIIAPLASARAACVLEQFPDTAQRRLALADRSHLTGIGPHTCALAAPVDWRSLRAATRSQPMGTKRQCPSGLLVTSLQLMLSH
jgi:hypothetical protein